MLNYFVETFTMSNRLFSITLIIFSLSNPVFAQNIKYDLPGNKDLPKSRFVLKGLGSYDPTRITVSSRLIPWSEYLGPKQTTRSISPDRMVYEVLVAYCHLTPKGDRPYYFKAIDAQTKVTLTERKIEYTKNLMSISPMAKYGQKEEYVRCGSV
jgi:hypothetical protein